MLEQHLAELQAELGAAWRAYLDGQLLRRSIRDITDDIAKTRYAIKMRDHEDALRAIYRDEL